MLMMCFLHFRELNFLNSSLLLTISVRCLERNMFVAVQNFIEPLMSATRHSQITMPREYFILYVLYLYLSRLLGIFAMEGAAA